MYRLVEEKMREYLWSCIRGTWPHEPYALHSCSGRAVSWLLIYLCAHGPIFIEMSSSHLEEKEYSPSACVNTYFYVFCTDNPSSLVTSLTEIWLKPIQRELSQCFCLQHFLQIMNAFVRDGLSSTGDAVPFWLKFVSGIHLCMRQNMTSRCRVSTDGPSVSRNCAVSRGSKDWFTETDSQVLTGWFQELCAGGQHIIWITKGRRKNNTWVSPLKKRQVAKNSVEFVEDGLIPHFLFSTAANMVWCEK